MPEGTRFDARQTAAEVITLLEAELEAQGFQLLDVRVFRGGGRVQLRIFVDTAAGGITLDEVATAARTAGMLLEEADPFADPYVIEVSSPGVRRPLRTLAHFQAVVGQRIEVKVAVPDGAKRLRGTLLAVENTALVIRPLPKAVDAAEDGTESEAPPAEAAPPRDPVTIGMGRVREANLDPDFDVQALINADRRQKKEQKKQERLERPKRRKGRPKNKLPDATPTGSAEGSGEK